MILFWRVNLWASVVVFVFFMVSFLEMADELVLNSIGRVFWIFFLYGPYLELIQVPVCFLALFVKPRPRRWALCVLLMLVFFLIKNLILVYILASTFERR